MSKIFSMCLYFISFAPLWLSVIFIDVKSIIENDQYLATEIISISMILIGMLVGLGAMIFGLCMSGRAGRSEYNLKSVKEEKTITAEYLLSYILPLFAFDFTLWNEVVLFLIFFITFGFLCIRHNYFSVNIILELVNFRFYQCELENEDGVIIEKRIISHRKLNSFKGENILVKSLNNEYMLDGNTLNSQLKIGCK
ncbi:MAG: hypothetical protein KH304_19155 [Clostridium sp.]|nr:hypothetical protein [Clostridium sp.]